MHQVQKKFEIHGSLLPCDLADEPLKRIDQRSSIHWRSSWTIFRKLFLWAAVSRPWAHSISPFRHLISYWQSERTRAQAFLSVEPLLLTLYVGPRHLSELEYPMLRSCSSFLWAPLQGSPPQTVYSAVCQFSVFNKSMCNSRMWFTFLIATSIELYNCSRQFCVESEDVYVTLERLSQFWSCSKNDKKF